MDANMQEVGRLVGIVTSNVLFTLQTTGEFRIEHISPTHSTQRESLGCNTSLPPMAYIEIDNLGGSAWYSW